MNDTTAGNEGGMGRSCHESPPLVDRKSRAVVDCSPTITQSELPDEASICAALGRGMSVGEGEAAVAVGAAVVAAGVGVGLATARLGLAVALGPAEHATASAASAQTANRRMAAVSSATLDGASEFARTTATSPRTARAYAGATSRTGTGALVAARTARSMTTSPETMRPIAKTMTVCAGNVVSRAEAANGAMVPRMPINE